jgi:hypothetical protein
MRFSAERAFESLRHDAEPEAAKGRPESCGWTGVLSSEPYDPLEVPERTGLFTPPAGTG